MKPDPKIVRKWMHGADALPEEDLIYEWRTGWKVILEYSPMSWLADQYSVVKGGKNDAR